MTAKHASFFVLLLILSASVSTTSCAGDSENGTAIRQIAVMGTGKLTAAPDMATVSFSFSQRARESVQAKRLVDTQVTNLLKLCGQLDIPAADINAAQLNVYPEYDYKNNRQLTGYRVTRNIRVKLRDLTLYPRFLEGAIGIGATQGGNAEFGFSDRDALENKALLKAFEQAEGKARLLAKKADSQLGEVIYINETGYQSPPQPGPRMAMVKSEAASYPTGEMEITRQLQVRFALQ